MTQTTDGSLDALRSRLDASITGDDVAAIAQRVKSVLQDALRRNSLPLPARFQSARPDTYARRLLHRDPDGRYTAVVMTWGPGQGTALHDHAGIWCVECVVDGRMEVTQFDLIGESGGTYRFEEKTRVTAERGAAGCLIPPFEYHTLANALDRPSITLHVYGGEMDHCHVFEPASAGAWRRVRRDLSYHE
jgi:predicted metal-dependent enzyme (double-stranded beta helix superfamily)